MYPTIGSQPTIRSPSRVSRSRRTPWVAGCCGPMLSTMSVVASSEPDPVPPRSYAGSNPAAPAPTPTTFSVLMPPIVTGLRRGRSLRTLGCQLDAGFSQAGRGAPAERGDHGGRGRDRGTARPRPDPRLAVRRTRGGCDRCRTGLGLDPDRPQPAVLEVRGTRGRAAG